MAPTEYLASGWRRFLDALQSDERRRLVDFLRDEYIDEVKDAAQFEEHARRMVYPHFRERLQRISAEEKAHVEWLREKIRALGGAVPEPSVQVRQGGNPWENLLLDVEEEKRDGVLMLEKLYMVAERVDPELAAGLRRMYEDEARHREEIMDLLMRSDPQAFATTPLAGQGRQEK